MKKKYYGLGLFAVGLVILFFYQAVYWIENANQKTVLFNSIIENAGMTAWHNGKKQWQIQTDKITTTNDIITFVDVKDGILFREGASDASFSASNIEYNEKTNQLEFPSGLKLMLDDKYYILEYAIWDGKKRNLFGKNITLKQDKGFQMNAAEMRYSAESNTFRWSKDIIIVKTGSGEGNILIVSEGLEYIPEKKEWVVKDNAVLKWEDKQAGQTYEFNTAEFFFDDTFSSISLPNQIIFKGNHFAGTGQGAMGNLKKMVINAISVADSSSNSSIYADQAIVMGKAWNFKGNIKYITEDGCTITASEADMNNEGQYTFWNSKGTMNQETELNAEKLDVNNGNITATGLVEIKKKEMLIYCDTYKSSAGDKIYHFSGNVQFHPHKGTTIFSDEMIMNQNIDKGSLWKAKIIQEAGATIIGDRADYDNQLKVIIVEDHVIAESMDGRHVTADKVTYDIDKRKLEFSGHIKSNAKESQ